MVFNTSSCAFSQGRLEISEGAVAAGEESSERGKIEAVKIKEDRSQNHEAQLPLHCSYWA